jgi:uncharacterized protein (TIGR02271 family)
MANIYSGNATTAESSTGYSSLTAFFDSRSDAESAVRRLRDAGIPNDSIRMVPGYEADDSSSLAGDDRGGFWAKLEDFFFPDSDREVYSEGLRRGGILVSVTNISKDHYETAHDILDDEGSIDLDERADLWRSEGWGTAGSTGRVDISHEAASASREDAFAAGRDETIPVVAENLRVGKRDVNAGSVRVRTHVVEQPVREDVTLREENVAIERRTVDRPVSDIDRAFQDRTISAEEHHEEAVVAKDARVVEEIGIRKTATDRTETIADSVRKTEVEVEDQRSSSQSQNSMGQTQPRGFRQD